MRLSRKHYRAIFKKNDNLPDYIKGHIYYIKTTKYL